MKKRKKQEIKKTKITMRRRREEKGTQINKYQTGKSLSFPKRKFKT